MEATLENFWNFCRERYSIWYKKEILKELPPWSEDLIFQQNHFCNIYREFDRGTLWYLDMIDDEVITAQDILWKTVLYRVVNNADWFEKTEGIPDIEEWRNPKDREETIERFRKAGIPHSKAYRILKSPYPHNHHDRLIEVLDENIEKLPKVCSLLEGAKELEEIWQALQIFSGVGPFIAMQIFRDLILVDAIPFTDDDFCYIGPGAIPVIEKLLGNENIAVPNSGSRNPRHYEFLQRTTDLQPFTEDGKDSDPWRLSLCDIEHSLCEFRKYLSIANNEARKVRKYEPRSSNVSVC